MGLFVNVFLALDLFIVQIDFREFLRLIDCRNFIVGWVGSGMKRKGCFRKNVWLVWPKYNISKILMIFIKYYFDILSTTLIKYRAQ